MKKTRGQKSRATVPLILAPAFCSLSHFLTWPLLFYTLIYLTSVVLYNNIPDLCCSIHWYTWPLLFYTLIYLTSVVLYIDVPDLCCSIHWYTWPLLVLTFPHLTSAGPNGYKLDLASTFRKSDPLALTMLQELLLDHHISTLDLLSLQVFLQLTAVSHGC